MTVILLWLKNFWTNHRQAILMVGGAILLFLLGFGTAKFASPAKVTTKTVTEVKTNTVTEIKYQDRVVVQKVYVATEAVQTHTSEVITKKPDGSIVEQKTVDTSTKDSQNLNVNKTDDKSQQTQVAQQTVSNTVTTKTVQSQPNWNIRGGVGYSIPYAINGTQVGISGLKGFVVEVGVERRILGPVSIGAFANTQGVLGLTLGGSF